MIRVGAGSGHPGDDLRGAAEVLADGVDYLGFECLAEVTLAAMVAEHERDERLGYSPTLRAAAELFLPAALEGRTKIITNGGGHNPLGATRLIRETARDLGIEGLRLGTVVGADLMGQMAQLLAAGEEFRNIDTGEPLDSLDGLIFATSYLGAYPVADALAQ